MTIDWNTTCANVYRPKNNYLKPVSHIDAVSLDSLIGIDAQKTSLIENTERFLSGRLATN